MHISAVSPVYRAEKLVPELVRQTAHYLSQITDSFEIILVEDGSPDASWEAIEAVCAEFPYVKGVKLSRNFGQHYAITAGLAQAQGDWVIVMDCDLQDRPDQFEKLYAQTQQGYEVVFARRANRTDSWSKRMSSKIFYTVFGYLTDTKQDPAIANFGIYHRKAVDAILSMKDHIRYFPTMAQWVGFRKTYVDVAHGERAEGESSYSLRRLLQLAFNNIIAFSDKPLRLTIRIGLLFVLFSILIAGFYAVQYFIGNIKVSGYASLIISIWFLSGMMIFILGVFGVYMGKMFDRVKDRPTYIVSETLNISP